MSNKVIPIFYACDDAFVKYTIVSLKSIIENASKDYQYKVHVLHTDISLDMMNKTKELANDNFSIEFNNVDSFLKSISHKLPLRHYYSKTTYYRLFIAEMFPDYDKAIYIDSDTVVLGDIAELYNHDLGDNYIGACNEQAMVQVDVYGTYCETVVGVDRNQFFNAGMMVINCVQFRQKKILDQFIKLLGTYNFIVTQDEDYLNVICKGKVKWIDNSWNTEVIGDIKYSDDEINMIHYIMVAKPWQFHDCRLKHHFWKYAEMTSVYQEILDVLNNYTDEQRAKAMASADELYQMAIDETARPDSYWKVVSAQCQK